MYKETKCIYVLPNFSTKCENVALHFEPPPFFLTLTLALPLLPPHLLTSPPPSLLQLVCSEVSTQCFTDICEFSWAVSGLQPGQGIRFLSAIFLYEGVIHLILISIFKFPIMWKIETRIRCVCVCVCMLMCVCVYVCMYVCAHSM